MMRRSASGRPLCSEASAAERGFGDAQSARRRVVLRETIEAFSNAGPPDRYHRLAADNLTRWRAERNASDSRLRVEICKGDWGDVTYSMTQAYGECFAVLNMANAYVPGGAYVEGAVAQEENMFRRTDCHFRIGAEEYDSTLDRYVEEVTALLSARDRVVYLDAVHPRVCIRGSEDRSRTDLGYAWLADDRIFPFFELRAAAQDLRDGSRFDIGDGRRRIAAQLDTLRAHRIRHAILGAFGCGAFGNPAHEVALLYREAIAARAKDFDIIAFAIFAAGYGPDNYRPFAEIFGTDSTAC